MSGFTGTGWPLRRSCAYVRAQNEAGPWEPVGTEFVRRCFAGVIPLAAVFAELNAGAVVPHPSGRIYARAMGERRASPARRAVG